MDDEGVLSAVKQSNVQCDGDIDASIENILKAVRILNKEEF